ncbi:hypothetical protein [Actinomadura decatromicini]|uniref:Uncharacterized protein n=1 Tax=Actinomadura decatromicini TaxID=2604572 RepID=A0A5D3FAL2_9ACTN|nr:hypothetical protein [Actinomadura decatromicini]TYK45129.1 hypothetical protein FXF68_31085 [Actinomadura decatromicini]
MSDRFTQNQLSERTIYSIAPPENRLIAHNDRVYRVVSVSPPGNEDGQGLWHWTLRPEHRTGPDEHFEGDEQRSWRVLPAHHAVCAECGEPVPCRRLREQWAAVHASRRARDLMSIPEGACWSCREMTTNRQSVILFPGENLFLPAGPPVTFHTGRQACRHSAMEYQEKWIAADVTRKPLIDWVDPFSGHPNPTQRRLLAMAAAGELHCHGTLVYHAGPDTDLSAILRGEARDTAEYQWYPSNLTAVQVRYLDPLIASGLIVKPVRGDRGGREGVYRLSDEGWRTHRQYPPKSS